MKFWQRKNKLIKIEGVPEKRKEKNFTRKKI
jgi:hypothetical protein